LHCVPIFGEYPSGVVSQSEPGVALVSGAVSDDTENPGTVVSVPLLNVGAGMAVVAVDVVVIVAIVVVVVAIVDVVIVESIPDSAVFDDGTPFSGGGGGASLNNTSNTF
jgi:hypothetical protein